MSRASGLFRLQTIDQELDRLRERRSRILAILEDSSLLRKTQQLLEEKEADLRSAEARAKRAELALQTQQEKIQGTERALYGGSVQNPKELQDLHAESEALNRHLVTLEDRLLEAMLLQEEIEQEHDAMAEQLAKLEAKQAKEHEALIQERKEIDAKLGSLEIEREAAAASVADQDREHYEKLRTRHAGRAVATLQDGACSACGIAVAASTQQVIRSGSELVSCPQCNRVLYSG